MGKMAKIATCSKSRKNVRLLDCQADANHDRCMITAVGEPETLRNAVINSSEVAVQLIDMARHERQRPRMGAVDVVSSAPCRNATVARVDAIAKEVGKAVGEKSSIPIFLYEDFATASHKVNLAKVRKGQFGGMAERLQDKELWTSNFGPGHTHPAVSVVAIGTGMPLTAYNVSLDMDNMEIAGHIADAVKDIRGGYHFIKAIGVELKGHYFGRNIVAQVSMNLVNYEKTAICCIFEAVKMEARRYGVNTLESEIAGVVPIQLLIDCAEYYLQACMFGPVKLDAKRWITGNWFLEDEKEEA